MSKSINEHEGRKYLRAIRDAIDPTIIIQVDIYAVLVAFNVTCPARGHAIKKLLCAGNRGKGTELDDLIGADAALSRAIDLERNKNRPLINSVNQELKNNILGKIGNITQEGDTVSNLPLPLDPAGFTFGSKPIPKFVENYPLGKITNEQIQKEKEDMELQKKNEQYNKYVKSLGIPKEESDPKEYE